MTRPITARRPVAVLDNGVAANVGALFFYYKVRGANAREREALRFVIASAVLE